MLFPRLILGLLLSVYASHVAAVDTDAMARFFGLRLLSRGAPWTFPGVHAIYTNSTLERQMMVMENMPGKVPERMWEDGDMVVLNLPTTEGHFTSLALINVGRERVEAFFKQTTFLQKVWRQLDPFPSAHAQMWGCERCRLPTLDSLADLEPAFAQDHWRRMMTCLGPMLRGAWDSTGGLVTSAVNGVRDLVTDPRGFWNERREQMRQLGSFLRHFDTKIREMAVGIARLPAQVKATLLCSFAGSLGTDALISILTGGAGAAAVILRLDRYLARVVRLERVISVLSAANRLPSGNTPFFQALAAGRVGDDAIDALHGFSQHGMTDLMAGVIACPL